MNIVCPAPCCCCEVVLRGNQEILLLQFTAPGHSSDRHYDGIMSTINVTGTALYAAFTERRLYQVQRRFLWPASDSASGRSDFHPQNAQMFPGGHAPR